MFPRNGPKWLPKNIETVVWPRSMNEEKEREKESDEIAYGPYKLISAERSTNLRFGRAMPTRDGMRTSLTSLR
jgi:hypothetical protein